LRPGYFAFQARQRSTTGCPLGLSRMTHLTGFTYAFW
jgi:hypothetical protein